LLSGPTSQTRAVWLKDSSSVGILRRREHHHPVLLGDVEEAVLGEAHAVRDDEVDRRCEALHLVRHAVLVAVGDHPHVFLAGADENRNPLRPDCHVTGIRDDREELDLEAVRDFDLLQIGAKLVGIFPCLLDRFEIGRGRACGLHRPELLQIVLRLCDRREAEGSRSHRGK
jgi:hypothetical protein